MSDLFRPTKIVTGTRRVPVRPPRTVRPPTESGSAPSLDPGDWETFNAGISSVDVTYPTGVAGDMILLCGYESVGGGFTTPTGFTEVFYTINGTIGVALYARISDGNESGSVSVPTGGANAVVNTNRLVANGATLSIAQIVSNVNSSGVNPPAITLLDAEYVVLTGLLFDGSSAVVNAPPTDYEYGVLGRFGSDIFGGVAQQLVTGPGTEDPAAWDATASIVTDAMSWTAGVQIDPNPPSVADPDHAHLEADVTDLDHTTTVAKAGTEVGTRGRINFIEGTDITLTVTDDAANDEVDVTIESTASGGGGGATAPTWVERLDSVSGTAHTDDDEFDDASIAGAWTQIAPPTGSATWTEGDDLLSLLMSGQSGGDQALIVREMTTATAPITIQTSARAMFINSGNPMFGMVFTDGTLSTSNLVGWGVYNSSGSYVIARWTGTPNTASTANIQTALLPSNSGFFYLRFIWTTTNTWAWAVSPDGVTWTDFAASTFAATLTPTHYGLFGSTWTSSAANHVAAFEYFRVSETDESV